MIFQPTAKVLADSIADNGHRLTTMEVTGHRFILAEFNTHRAFSRNSASSRAIPYAKMREKVFSQLAYPVSWPAEQSGMQGGVELSLDTIHELQRDWHEAAMSVVDIADTMVERGLHKSVVNRILEPFLPHTIIVSATEWQGFWDQRCHPDAQPEIHELADRMLEAYIASTPVPVAMGEWHLPLIHEEDWHIASQTVGNEESGSHWDAMVEHLKKISVARCARVSYLTHDGVRDHSKDLELYSRLHNHSPSHASPFEHVATPADWTEKFSGTRIADDVEGNFVGWEQLRHTLGMW